MNTQLVVEPEKKQHTAARQASTGAATATATAFRSGVQQPRAMFSQTFVELSDADRRRKRATQTGSFIVQSLIVGVLVVLPLWFVDVLPMQQLSTFLVAPPPPPPPPPPAAPMVKVARVSEVVNGSLRTPSRIPKTVKMIKEEEAPFPANGGVIGGVEGGVPGGQVNGVLGSLLPTTHSSAPPIVAPPPKRLRISTGISEGMLARRVEPVYPAIAMRARIEGTVKLRAIISKQGTIDNLQLVNGHPLLVSSAMEAVKQWRYRPYVLNGEPVEIETIVIVNFHIN
jgi:periplasmic protein TonB